VDSTPERLNWRCFLNDDLVGIVGALHEFGGFTTR
jgi:hypothetical protein